MPESNNIRFNPEFLEKIQVAKKHSKSKASLTEEPLPLSSCTLHSDRILRAVETGLLDACDCGVLLNYPLINLDITVDWIDGNPESTEMAFRAAASHILLECVRQSDARLAEPVVEMEIVRIFVDCSYFFVSLLPPLRSIFVILSFE